MKQRYNYDHDRRAVIERYLLASCKQQGEFGGYGFHILCEPTRRLISDGYIMLDATSYAALPDRKQWHLRALPHGIHGVWRDAVDEGKGIATLGEKWDEYEAYEPIGVLDLTRALEVGPIVYGYGVGRTREEHLHVLLLARADGAREKVLVRADALALFGDGAFRTLAGCSPRNSERRVFELLQGGLVRVRDARNEAHRPTLGYIMSTHPALKGTEVAPNADDLPYWFDEEGRRVLAAAHASAEEVTA